jgi:hypothetical protein
MTPFGNTFVPSGNGGGGGSADGWNLIPFPAARIAADDPTYSIVFYGVNIVSLLSEGIPVKWDQNGTTRYGFVNSSAVLSGSNTTLKIITRLDDASPNYDLLDTSVYPITNFYTGLPKQPGLGFPLLDSFWTLKTLDTTLRFKNYPNQNQIYYSEMGSINIIVPIGYFDIGFYGAIWGTGSGGNSGIIVSLSDSVSAHNPRIQAGGLINVSTGFGVWGASSRKSISLTSKTTYYMLASTIYTGGQAIYFYNNYIEMEVSAKLKYL